MKNTLVVALAAVMSVGIACAGTNSLPTPTTASVSITQASSPSLCTGQAVCDSARVALSPGEGSPMPLCPPGHNCTGQLRQIAGEGSPMPLCPPGQNCTGQLRQIAGEGSPMPLCPPGQNCTGQLRQIAGEGSPMPLCPPGQNCTGQLRPAVAEGSPADVRSRRMAG
jgi:hypothetical protein